MIVSTAAFLCLSLNVYHEARGEPEAGQMAVAYVTLNRATYNKQSICDTVKAEGQFSWTADHEMKEPKKNKEWDKAKDVAKQALAAHDTLAIPLMNALNYFHNTSVKPTWRLQRKFVTRIGNHLFYK